MVLRALSNAEYVADVVGAALAYPAYRRRESWSTDRLRAWQLRRVRSLVDRAYASVPVYRERYGAAGYHPGDIRTWDDFARLPTITKVDLVGAYPERSVGGRHPAGPLPDLDELRVDRSDDGDPPPSRPALALCPGHRAPVPGRLAGRYPPSWRQAYIYTSPYPRPWLARALPDRHSSRPRTTRRRCSTRCGAAGRSSWRSTRPSCATSWPPTPRRCGPSACGASPSRASTRRPEERRRLGGRCWAAAVGDQYSSEELAYIAAECAGGDLSPRRGHDPRRDRRAADADRPVDGIGEVVGTELHNRTMPFIRYRQGDLARVETGTCSCRPTAGPVRRLTELAGRANDGFILADGRTLSPGFLLDACYRAILPRPAEVAAYRLVQTAPDRADPGGRPGPDLGRGERRAARRGAGRRARRSTFRATSGSSSGSSRAEAGKRATIVRQSVAQRSVK